MSDPRGNLTFKCQAAAAQQQSAMRNFGNAVGKVGDLEILNKVGGGAIGRGLRTIASVSNSIRTGCGSLPTTIGSTIESGAKWVLEQTGIGSATVDAVRNFNPHIANQAWGQAQQIFQKAKQGKFKITDIPGALQDFQNLERLGRNIFTPGNVQSGMSVNCFNSRYAMDLISRAPKHKFMFVVSFTFNTEYASLMRIAEEMAFVVKRSTRPNIKFQTEDVNYYNFRSKVITRTEFEEMDMTFHDDMQNNSMAFYNAYRNAMVPITNVDGRNGLINPENQGLDFTQALNSVHPINYTIPTNNYTGSRGPLQGDTADILKDIRLYHVFDGGRKMNVFIFMNPRISLMKLDDLDMASSEGSEVGISFNYDSVYIETDVDANSMHYTSGPNFLPGSTSGAVYPLRFNDTAGAMDAAHASAPVGGGTGGQSNCNGTNQTNTKGNPFSQLFNF
jgi:hypothetical protein